MKLQTVSGLLSNVIATSFFGTQFNAIDTNKLPCNQVIPSCLTKPADKTNCDLTHKRPVCKGILPGCVSVTSRNYLLTGESTRAFRKATKKLENKLVLSSDLIILCSKQSSCRSMSFDRFYNAVLATIKIMVKHDNYRLSKTGNLVIEHIYAAGIKNDATCEQLINFTATAMHNLSLFTRFPACGNNNNIGDVTRGLMQWLYLTEYTKLSSVSSINYLYNASSLDHLTAETINDEFVAYLKYYNNNALWGVNAFIFTIKAFNSVEAKYVNENVAHSILLGTFKPANYDESRILNRFTIYYLLTSRVFNNRSCIPFTSENK